VLEKEEEEAPEVGAAWTTTEEEAAAAEDDTEEEDSVPLNPPEKARKIPLSLLDLLGISPDPVVDEA
jgi:hypothetical protein